MATVNNAKPSDRFTRLVKRAHQETDGDGNPIGILPAAFDLRAGEVYLSCNCIDLVGASNDADAIEAIVHCLRKKLKTKKCLLAIGQVEKIISAFHPGRVRATCEPSSKDPTYATLRQYPAERRLALERLANDHWNDWVKIED